MGNEYKFEMDEMECVMDLGPFVMSITRKFQEHTMAAFVASIITAWAEVHDASAKEIAVRIAKVIGKTEESIKKLEIPEELMEEEAIKWIIGAGALNNETLEN